MMRYRAYDAQKDWKERESTAVAAIIAMILSLVLFITGASLLFSWVDKDQRAKKAKSEEQVVLSEVREHYSLEPTYADKSLKVKEEEDGKKYFLIIASGRVFKVERHIEDNNITINNIEEIYYWEEI